VSQVPAARDSQKQLHSNKQPGSIARVDNVFNQGGSYQIRW
jgi:hypothetical protein